MTEQQIKKQIAVVTGASRGIGSSGACGKGDLCDH